VTYGERGDGRSRGVGGERTPVSITAHAGKPSGPPAAAGWRRVEALLALGAFAAMCVLALSFTPDLAEPDDYAYHASIVAMTQRHFLTLSTAQYQALAGQPPPPPGTPGGIPQWTQLADGRWISQKDPGYPFLAAPFQALGVIRLAPLFYGALACLGLFFGGRRWLGRFGGAAAVGLYCSSGAALLFAWRDYMATFTDASLIAAGTGALLWAVLATDARPRRRTWAGLAGFIALEAAAFTRYTDIVVLGCAAVAALAAWRVPTVRLPRAVPGWWLGSAVVFAAGMALFDALVYGGPLKSAYPPGLIKFSLSAVLPNVRNDMPAHIIEAMPMLILGLTAVAWIAWRWARRRRTGGEPAVSARRDAAACLALAASWAATWGLYVSYTWTTFPGLAAVDVARFYVPAIGPIALLSAWPLVRVPRRAPVAALTCVAVVVAMFGLGAWSYASMRDSLLGPCSMQHPCPIHREQSRTLRE
jgi:hypothetical protein